MRYFFKLFVTLSVLLVCAACASSGNKKLASMKQHELTSMFTEGKSTKNEVKLTLGEPSDIDFDHNNCEKWTYEHIKSSSKAVNFIPVVNYFVRGTNDTKKKLVIVFDEQGVIKHQAYAQSKGESKAGILG